MPTICKIQLDAAEYMQDLTKVVSASRAASAALAASFGDASAQAQNFDKSVADIADREIKIKASVETEPMGAVAGPDVAATAPVIVDADTTPAVAKIDELQTAIDDLPPAEVKADVVVNTVEIARLKAEIASLEGKEIEAQVKVVDDDIALLQTELDAIQNKDITVRTDADVEQAAKLRSVIAQLQDKKVAIKTEVHSDQLDQLRNKLDAATGSSNRAGAAIRGMARGNIGEQINKGATAISALGSVAGAAVPPVGMLGAVVSALRDPIALITAALAALVAIGINVWDKLTVSTEEFAESAKRASDNTQKQLDKTRELDAAAAGYLARLHELDSAETIGNTAKAETAQLLQALEGRYGSLGAVIDQTTGKVTNLLDVEERLNAARSKELADKNNKVAESKKNEAKAAYMKVKGDEYLTTEGEAGDEFDEMQKTVPLETQIAMMRRKSKEATTQSDITGYDDVANKLQEQLDAQNRAKLAGATGYENKDDAVKAVAAKSAASATAKQAFFAAQKQADERRSDDEFNNLKDADKKIDNRQQRIGYEKSGQAQIEKDLAVADQDLVEANKSGDQSKIADATKRKYEIELQLQGSLDRQYALQSQINAVEKARADASKKMTDQAQYELDYNKLIAAGEYDKAAALKLEKELKDQNLQMSEEEKQAQLDLRKAQEQQGTDKMIADAKEQVNLNQLLVDGNYAAYEAEKLRLEMKKQGKTLTKEETAELLKQRQQQGAQNLQKKQRGQAYDLYGQAMEKAGKGKEFAEQKALKDARDTKGGDLTDAESEMVKKLSALSYGVAHDPGAQLGDTSVKTNSLTARGGFAGGAKVPDTEKINREIAASSKQQLAVAQKINTLLESLING